MSYIADELDIKDSAAKLHTLNIYRKMGINSKQELIDIYLND